MRLWPRIATHLIKLCGWPVIERSQLSGVAAKLGRADTAFDFVRFVRGNCDAGQLVLGRNYLLLLDLLLVA